MTVVLVDWLGRGGIAQTSEAWVRAMRSHGHETIVVSRLGRELDVDAGVTDDGCLARLPGPAGTVAVHRALAQRAAAVIESTRPSVVVIQNYVVSPLETVVDEAARRVGAKLVMVVHDHRLHTVFGGTRCGLARRLSRADSVVVHSDFVGRGVKEFSPSTRPRTVPLPTAVGLLEADRPAEVLRADERATALTVGVLHRAYKGTGTVASLVGTDGWRMALCGLGAPTVPGAVTVDRFLGAGELARVVEESDAVLLPYRIATQSAVVVLAHALGSVPVATAVGGISEQIVDGVDGRLLRPRATIDEWRAALAGLGDPARRASMADAGRARIVRDDRIFRAAVDELVA